eukprot:6205031-Pleurochrysis_carterae.AAC.1
MEKVLASTTSRRAQPREQAPRDRALRALIGVGKGRMTPQERAAIRMSEGMCARLVKRIHTERQLARMSAELCSYSCALDV